MKEKKFIWQQNLKMNLNKEKESNEIEKIKEIEEI